MRLNFLLLGCSLSALMIAACGDDDDSRPGQFQPGEGGADAGSSGSSRGGRGGGNQGGGDGGAADAGSPGLGGGDSGGGSGQEGGAAGGPQGTGALGGTIEVTTIPDTPCVEAGGTPVELYAAGQAVALFDRMEKVGLGRVAGGEQAQGFVTFAADGTNPSGLLTLAPNLNYFASEGDTFGAIGTWEDQVLYYQRYDSPGTLAGPALALDDEVDQVATLAGGGGEALVIWSNVNQLMARGVSDQGEFAGPAFALSENPASSLVAARSDDTFGVVWTEGADMDRAMFARASTTGLESEPTEILATDEPHSLLKLVATAQGFVLVVVSGLGADEFQYFVRLDVDGGPVGEARRLDGSYLGWDLASNGDALGFVATRIETFQPSFRALDQNLDALGPWVCLDESSETFDAVAVDGDGTGFAVLYMAAPVDAGDVDRAVLFRQFDQVGTGVP